MKKTAVLFAGLALSVLLLTGCDFNFSRTGTVVLKNGSYHRLEAVIYAAGPGFSDYSRVNIAEPFLPGRQIEFHLAEGRYRIRVYILPLTGETIDIPAAQTEITVQMKKTNSLVFYGINHLGPG